MDLSTDLDLFISADTPGAVPCTAAGASFYGVFDNDYAELLGLSAAQPLLLGKSADLDPLNQGSLISVAGTNYSVGESRPDGHGLTAIILRRTA